MAQKPNVLLVVVDQLRADCVTGALASHIDLPNIQAFRSEAVTFANHFTVTTPCGPARSSLLTGLYAMNHRAVRNGAPLDRRLPNLALQARQSGYAPMLFGYTDTSRDPRDFHANDPALADEEMVMPGFEEVLEMRYQMSMPWRAHLKAKGYALPEYSNFYHPVPTKANGPARIDDPAFYRAEDSDTAFLTDELLKNLSVRTDQHWFALATYIRPHPPLVAPTPYNKMYDPHDLPLPTRLPTPNDEAAVHPFLKGALKRPKMDEIVRGFSGLLDTGSDDDVQTLRSVYLGLATEVDWHFGRIISFLKDSGQYENTIVVFTSDHGETLGDHHMWGKQNIYEASFRVPLIIRNPADPDQFGTTVQEFSESIDVTPTVLALIGAKVPASMNGKSLQPFLHGDTPKGWRDCVHLELDFGEPDKTTVWQQSTGCSFHAANLAILREQQYKLVHFNGDLAPLLFDLHADPGELNDLAGEADHSATLLRLTQKLLSFQMRHRDTTLSDMKVGPGGVIQFDG